MTKSKLEFIPTYERLPSYLRLAEQAEAKNQMYISGTSIAQTLGLSAIQVRKDLAYSGLSGTPKRGYKTSDVVKGLKRFLTWDKPKKTFLIGVGNLGKAIILHDEFRNRELDIIAIFDNDKEKVGEEVGGLKVLDVSTLDEKCAELKPEIAILTTSKDTNVGNLALLLAEKGIKGIWNFTMEKIVIDANVAVYNTDLSSSFAVLCADMEKRKKNI